MSKSAPVPTDRSFQLRVMYTKSIKHFYFAVSDQPEFKQWNLLMREMAQFYNSPAGSSLRLSAEPCVGKLYAVKYDHYEWYRCRLMSVDAEGRMNFVIVDYGEPLSVDVSERCRVAELKSEFDQLPRIATKASLPFVFHKPGKVDEANSYFLDLLRNRDLYGFCIPDSDKNPCLVSIYLGEVIFGCMNDQVESVESKLRSAGLVYLPEEYLCIRS